MIDASKAQEHTNPPFSMFPRKVLSLPLLRGRESYYFFDVFFVLGVGDGCFSGSSMSSDIFKDDRCHVRTAGERGCWRRALPVALVRQWSLDS